MRMMKLNGHLKTTLYELDGYDHGMTRTRVSVNDKRNIEDC